jgi:ribonuclease HI
VIILIRDCFEWLSEKKCQTKLVYHEDAKELWKQIRWAENWLEHHHYTGRVLKWQTELWGEIAADFNRK